MPQNQNVDRKVMIAELRSAGFKFHTGHGRGSHEKWRHPNGTTVLLARRGNEIYPKDVFRARKAIESIRKNDRRGGKMGEASHEAELVDGDVPEEMVPFLTGPAFRPVLPVGTRIIVQTLDPLTATAAGSTEKILVSAWDARMASGPESRVPSPESRAGKPGEPRVPSPESRAEIPHDGDNGKAVTSSTSAPVASTLPAKPERAFPLRPPSRPGPAVQAVVKFVNGKDGPVRVKDVFTALKITEEAAHYRLQIAVNNDLIRAEGQRAARRYFRKSPESRVTSRKSASRKSPESQVPSPKSRVQSPEPRVLNPEIPIAVLRRLGFEGDATADEALGRIDFMVSLVRSCRFELRTAGFDGESLPDQLGNALKEILDRKKELVETKHKLEAADRRAKDVKSMIRYLPSVEDRMPQLQELLRTINDPSSVTRLLVGRDLTADEFVATEWSRSGSLWGSRSSARRSNFRCPKDSGSSHESRVTSHESRAATRANRRER